MCITRTIMIVRRAARILFLALALLAPLTFIQKAMAQDITKGSIAGVVRDASGSVVVGAKVDVSGQFGSRSTTTDSSGNYVFSNLQVGSGYLISVAQAGFSEARASNLTVGVNQRTTVDLTLQI